MAMHIGEHCGHFGAPESRDGSPTPRRGPWRSDQARKWIGALATVLGGVDTLVFAGGIGEQSAVIRARICQGLAFHGIEVDEERNRTDAAVVSPAHVPVAVRVIPTNEELVIARSVARVLGVA